MAEDTISAVTTSLCEGAVARQCVVLGKSVYLVGSRII